MNDTERAGRKARGWPYVVTGVAFAGICAWISYNDGLFVARLAGNHDALAYFYPLLPDGLIILSLLALAEAARAKVDRSRWAMAGLLLGIALTLAMNTYAGVEHSPLDAVLDGMVPVVFFIAVEIVLWHVRRGRKAPAQPEATEQFLPPEFTDKIGAAEVAFRNSWRGGNPFKPYALATRFEIPRPVATEIVERVSAELAAYERSRGGSAPSVPAAEVPAGVLAATPPLAGASPNGRVTHG